MNNPFISPIKHLRTSLFLCISLFILLFQATPVRAGNSPVTVSDLDEIIRSLPRRIAVDRLSPLVSRLNVLNYSQTETRERTALTQAVALIRLMRTIRLTSAPIRKSTAALPLFAYATGNTASNGYRSDK
jgi:hypothetical protein